MTYIGVPQPARAITSEDISEGAVTLADIAFTDTPSNLNLNGLYNNQTMRLAHNITVTGDTTLENSKAFTVSSSGGLLVSSAGHNLSDNDQILVQSNATLPTGLSANTYYFVINKTTDTFKLSISIGGSAIAYTNAGSGTHTWFKDVNLILAKISDNGNPVTLTNDSSTRTITGIGSLETSTLAQTPNQSLTGMTGTVGSAVTNNAGVASGVIGSAVTGTLGSGVTFPAGMPINIVSTTKSDIQQLGAAYTETEISGLTCTITPKYTTSKIYISGHVSVGHTVATAWNYINIFRGSTRIGQGPSDGTSIQGHSATDNRAYAMRSLPINYIDSPNTTSTITYSIKHGSGSANARINKDGESSGANHVTGVSTLTVMEIAG